MEVLALIIAVAALAIAGIAIVTARQVDRENDPWARPGEVSSQEAMVDLIGRLEAVEAGIVQGPDEISDGHNAAPMTAAISRIGLVRFDAFEDAGGAQSFAVALLDETGDGIILTSLHSRPTTRVYVKAIRARAADAQLSEEEAMAMRQAGFEPA